MGAGTFQVTARAKPGINVVLSHSVIELLPLKSIIKEVIDNLGIDIEKLKFLSSSIV